MKSSDTERLDFLAETGAAIYRYGHGEWAVRKGRNFTHRSLRRAIDKAMIHYAMPTGIAPRASNAQSWVEREIQKEVRRAKGQITFVYSHWSADCGWCGKHALKAENRKHMIVCSNCGH